MNAINKFCMKANSCVFSCEIRIKLKYKLKCKINYTENLLRIKRIRSSLIRDLHFRESALNCPKLMK